ncbi:MAG TPA: tetratricopeptide repeat protein [Polyangiaceae bacterium]|nr:tetratricopeptide repeat protein [Polyangiaceae bacterium]
MTARDPSDTGMPTHKPKMRPRAPAIFKDIPTLPDEDVKDAFGEDETAGRFFSDAPVFLPPEDVHLVEEERPAARPEVTAAQRTRRRHLRRYVTAVVGLAAGLCLVAGVHATGRASAKDFHKASVDPPSPPRAVAVEAPPTETPAPTPPAPEAVEVAKAESPAPPPAESAAPASDPPAAALQASAPEPTAQDPAPAQDPQAALDAKHASQKALEGGHPKAAIEAGEKAVELDPTDAEAWLILGAAYLQRGAYAEAHKRFASCVEQAKRGPKGECAALLR